MTWELHIVTFAQKQINELRKKDKGIIISALQRMQGDPFGGNIEHLQNQPSAWRRRQGNWRILYDLYPEKRLIVVAEVCRRTTTTYRRK